MIYLFLADGFEEIETVGTLDILRRCDLQVQTLSVTGKRVVTGAHGLVIKADSLFRKNHIIHCEALVFPGGLRGAKTMMDNAVLRLTIQQHAFQGTLLAAICAAPMIFGAAGILAGKHATIYPGMQKYLQDAIYHDNTYVVENGNIITACGPAATSHFAFTIARKLVSNADVVERVQHDMTYIGHDDNFEYVLSL